MTVQVNGQQVSLEVQTLDELVDHYQLDHELVVTEVDGAIIAKEERSSTKIADGMKIELVHFVGGG